ncbi:transmembrane protein 143-like [Anneissia japonica]|uniref:transmembrane protein 143-like n=1 Tax=Anneissia japonica TaxID=1529436 RepID=UPI0014258489|nr:transmembrane protein 143-like [Anneissia japonica]
MAAKILLAESVNFLQVCRFSFFSANHIPVCTKCKNVVTSSSSSSKGLPPIRLCSTAKSSASTSDTKVVSGEQDAASKLPPVHDVREKFIPMSRRNLVRQLIQEEDFLNDDERKRFEAFAVSLDNAIVNQYHSTLSELKSLFDPLNPDKDTISSQQLSKQEKMDSEFWLLQKLSSVMEKANFHELPKHQVDEALAIHAAGEGVMVSVDTKNYDVLKFWALGKGAPTIRTPWYTRLASGAFYKVTKKTPPNPIKYYKRVVVAVRTKNSQTLMLKMFKEVPVTALEQLLPDGKIQMTKLDQGILATMIGIGTLSILVKSVSYLADLKLQWTLIAASVTGLVALNAFNSYKNRRTRYMVQLSRMLYYKNIANNRGLLTLLVDRAEDEALKEVLLVYAFLLTSRNSSTVLSDDSLSTSSALSVIGGLSVSELEHTIEAWIKNKTGGNIRFDSNSATTLLQNFGIMVDDDDCLGVVPIDAALLSLPRQPVSILERSKESDLEEGYDKVFFEQDSSYKFQDRKQKRHGWK